MEREFEGREIVVEVSNSDEFKEVDLGNRSGVLSFFEDEGQFVDFFGIRGREDSSGGGDLQGTAHGSVSNSGFTGAFFPGKVGFSEEKVIGKVKLISRVKSVE